MYLTTNNLTDANTESIIILCLGTKEFQSPIGWLCKELSERGTRNFLTRFLTNHEGSWTLELSRTRTGLVGDEVSSRLSYLLLACLEKKWDENYESLSRFLLRKFDPSKKNSTIRKGTKFQRLFQKVCPQTVRDGAMFCREVLLSRQNFPCQKDRHQVCLVSSQQCNTMQIHVSSRELLIQIYSGVNFLMSTWMYHDFNIRHFRMRTLDLNPKTKINYKPWYPLTQSIKRIVIMKQKARGRYFHTCLYKDDEQYCARTNFYSLTMWDSSFSCKCRRYCWNSWK